MKHPLDWIAHLAAGFAVAYIVSLALDWDGWQALAGLWAGLGKETFDYWRRSRTQSDPVPGWSWADIAFTVAGAAVFMEVL